jgi:hypothetical protein
MTVFILSALYITVLMVGAILGWIGQAMFTAHINYVEHDYEELFEKNPHPELFDEDGDVYRGEYMNVSFEPGYDPEDFNPGDVTMD